MDRTLRFTVFGLSLVSLLLSAGAFIVVTRGFTTKGPDDPFEQAAKIGRLERELEMMNSEVKSLTAANEALRYADQKLKERIEKLEP